MGKRDENLKEIIRGLDGLVMLGEWQTILARDLKGKAEAFSVTGEGPEPPPEPGPQKKA
jgi:hypothetical protein